MAVRRILRMGDPQLRRPADPVPAFDTEALHALIADLVDTMRANDGAGLAATQIGVPLRVVVFEIDANPRYPEAPTLPLTVLVNPEITPLGDAIVEGWEGCLSVPGLRGVVPRARAVRYRAHDAAGRAFVRDADGFHARVVQHECDHLDGVLFPDRVRDFTRFGFHEELQASGVLAPVHPT